MGYIYTIRNTKTGKQYIGQTVRSLQKRWRQHRIDLRNNQHRNIHLQRAWNKDGAEAFEFVLLAEAEPAELLNMMEAAYIEREGRSNLYNLREGGKSKYHHSAETRRKMSAAKMGKPSLCKGRTTSAEIRQKISDAKRGKPHGWAVPGRKHTIESKKKIGEASRHYWEIRHSSTSYKSTT